MGEVRAEAPSKGVGMAGNTSGEGEVWIQYSKFVDVDIFFANFGSFLVANVSAFVDFSVHLVRVLQQTNHSSDKPAVSKFLIANIGGLESFPNEPF